MKRQFLIKIKFTILPAILFFLTAPAVISTAQAESVPASRLTLPFDPLSYENMTGRPKKVFAHYHPAMPVSIDNLDASVDYYTRNYLNPDGENGKYKAVGGFLRTRPMPRYVSTSSTWKLDDMRKEVRLAKGIGLDGFAISMMNYQGVLWERTKMLLRAADLEGNFKIMLMPDMTATLEREPDRIIQMIEGLSQFPAAFRIDGNLVVSPFVAQRQTPAWWAGKLGELRQRGIPTKFVPVFFGWRKYYESYASLSHGVSDWGTRRPSKAHYLADMAREARDAGLVWMSPVAPQVMRPKNAYFLEAGNSELYREMWEAAIAGDANWVHLISWNDYSEHSVIHPSAPTGYGFYDLTAYYTRWFKTGSRPQITRDAIYSFYRIHPAGATPDPLVQTRVIEPGSASDTPRDRVEMLAFLTAPAVLQIKLAGKMYRKKAEAGVTSFTVPLQSGRPVFRIMRNGNVVKILRGKFIEPDIAIQDLLYHGDSSLR